MDAVRSQGGAHKPLAGKVALVTGASSGIGKAIAMAMADQGAKVVINYIGQAGAANEVVKAIEQSDGGGEAIAIRADVSQQRDVAAMIGQIVQRWEHLDVLVNNAGIEKEDPFLDKTPAPRS